MGFSGVFNSEGHIGPLIFPVLMAFSTIIDQDVLDLAHLESTLEGALDEERICIAIRKH